MVNVCWGKHQINGGIAKQFPVQSIGNCTINVHIINCPPYGLMRLILFRRKGFLIPHQFSTLPTSVSK